MGREETICLQLSALPRVEGLDRIRCLIAMAGLGTAMRIRDNHK